MIAHRSRRFTREPLVPIIRIQPITDFNFVPTIDLLMKETAISNQLIIRTMNDGELRWKPAALPTNDFVQKGGGLLPGKNTERKSHEIHVCHQLSQKIDIFSAERA